MESPYTKGSHPRDKYWIGKVGLIYPSDYGYATSGGSAINREACLADAVYNYGDNECTENWVMPHTYSPYGTFCFWTITPNPESATSTFVSCSWYIDDDITNGRYSYVADDDVTSDFDQYSVIPALYLKANILWTDGNGTKENPFVFDSCEGAVDGDGNCVVVNTGEPKL